MKFFIFLLFLVFIVSLSLVNATGFSPTQIDMNLEKNQKECQMITLESNSEAIQVYDKWAENKGVSWDVSLFNTDASSHGLSVTHPETLSLDQRQVQVCISGSKEGEYHGVLLLKEEQKGNSIMQMGIWLKVFIGDIANQQTTTATKTQTQTQNTANTNTENSAQVSLAVQKPADSATAKTTTETTKEADKATANGITGAAVGTNNNSGISILTIIFILVIIGAFIALFNYRRLQKRRMEYGY